MKLQLPSVTLMIVDCLNVHRSAKVLEICKSKADFGDIKLLTSIPTDNPHAVKIMPLNSLVAYSIFMLTKSHRYISTSHAMIVQRDGWILNPESFDRAWLNLDYIGPLFMQYDKVGSGGFSLRSKRLMDQTSRDLPDWDGSQHHADIIQKTLPYYEDGVISLSRYSTQFKIGSLEQAANFAAGGNRNPKYFRDFPFGFHRTWQHIDFKTGRVDSSDTSTDIKPSYEEEIDNYDFS
jgi:hypothetical protein